MAFLKTSISIVSYPCFEAVVKHCFDIANVITSCGLPLQLVILLRTHTIDLLKQNVHVKGKFLMPMCPYMDLLFPYSTQS